MATKQLDLDLLAVASGLPPVSSNYKRKKQNDHDNVVRHTPIYNDPAPIFEEPKARAGKGHNPEKSDKAPASGVDAPAHAPKAPDSRTLRERVQGLISALLPFIFFGAAAMGSYRSFTLCNAFFARYNPADGAFTMSVLLVAVAFATPQAVHILWPTVRQGKRIFLFTLCVLLSVASIGTNVIITAQELQNQKADSNIALVQAKAKADQLQASIDSLERQRAGIAESLELDKQERTILMEAQKGLAVGEYQYNRVRQNLADIKGRIDKATIALSDIDSQIVAIRADMPTMTATEAGMSDTWINWAGSIIIEIGGPVALALAISL
jgi:hypothetical protein